MNTIYIVTGATGWVGRNILHELQLRISIEEFNDKVIAFGSKFQRIKSTAYLRNKPLDIPVYPLSLSLEIIPKKSKLLIIHSAFLTREKIKYFGIKNYINTNKLITKSIIDIINESLESKVILMSSGAAASIQDEDINVEYNFLWKTSALFNLNFSNSLPPLYTAKYKVFKSQPFDLKVKVKG